MEVLTMREIKELIETGQKTNVEIIEETLAKLMSDETNSLITLMHDEALSQARVLDERGQVGYPIVIKDNINYRGVKMTCASKALENYESIYHATLTKKLIDNNYIVCGKANLDEFAMGSTNASSYFGKVLNPLDVTRVPGGSSGGSAAVVAANHIGISIGTDTGGSVRQPAAYCGLVGLRPTYGRISRYGIEDLYSGFDQAGIFSQTVLDNLAVLEAISGIDSYDSTSMEMPIDYRSLLNEDLVNKKVGIIDVATNNMSVKAYMQDVTKFLEESGCQIETFDFIHKDKANFVYDILLGSEITSNLSKYDGIRFGHQAASFNNLEELYKKTRQESFGDEVKRRLIIGMNALDKENYENIYVKALKMRRLIRDEVCNKLSQYDIIIMPTMTHVAHKFDEVPEDLTYEEYLIMTSIASVPSMSIPIAICKETKMPYGLLINASHFEEKVLYQFANYFEKHYQRKEV